MSLETQLRDALAARADDIDGPAADPYERVSGAVAASRRRRRTAAVGAVAAVVALAVLVPSLGQGGDRATQPAKRTQVVVPGPDDSRWGSLSTWPTRGSLATDAAFLAAVGSHLAAQHVVYAADLPTSRVVVTWDPDTGNDERLRMFAGPRGGSVQGLVEVSSASGGLGDVVLLREHADNDSTLVVLARPDVTAAAVSRSVQIGLDGSVTRDVFRRVRLVDGVYSELLQDSPSSLTRVTVGDGPSARVTLTGLPSVRVEDRSTICLNCTGDDVRAQAEKAMGSAVAVTLGLDPATVTTTTRYLGPVDRALASRLGMVEASGGTTRLIVGDSTLSTGQVLRSSVVLTQAKDGSSASTMELASGVPIDAATARVRPFVLHGSVSDSATVHYEVFAPAAAKVRLVSSSPSIHPPTQVLTPRGGAVLATTPSWSPGTTPYEVEAYDGSGTMLGRWPVDLPREDVWAEGTQP